MNKEKVYNNLVKFSAGGNNRALLKPMLNKALIISAFPGCGKTHFFNNNSTDDIILDSDSSKFDKAEFPSNYINHIKENIDKADIILVSSHKDVRDALCANDIDFILVYPDMSIKQEYLERYTERGSAETFIKLVDNNWNSWLDEVNNQKGCYRVRLKKQNYLSDIFTQ